MNTATTRYAPGESGAALIVLENDEIRVFELDRQVEWALGRRDPLQSSAPDIAFDSPIVSCTHGSLKHVYDRWYYVDDPHNTNGTYLNAVKIERSGAQRHPQPLKDGDVLRIDSSDLDRARPDGVWMLFTTQPGKGKWSSLPLEGKKELLIGRAADCGLVMPLPYVSARQARLSFSRGRWFLSDCGSMSGTYLNGELIQGRQRLREKDSISFSDCHVVFLGTHLLYQMRDRDEEAQSFGEIPPGERPVVLRADIDCKRVKNYSGGGMKELIRDIHLEIREGTLVALLGTAGAGKSTLMNCLNGMDLIGLQGQVLYRGVDLLQQFDRMKALIGSVPQKKIFHPSFTPEQEFRLAARKRLPADTTEEEICRCVDETLEMLSMTGIRSNRNSKLSGGEQTRVNIGIELVADRDLLCLDEPDQGLSPNYKHELFQIMRDLAHVRGKSVLSIIHDVSEIDMFDQVILLAKLDGVGRLAFSGSPEEARQHFGVDIRDVYALLDKDPGRFIK